MALEEELAGILKRGIRAYTGDENGQPNEAAQQEALIATAAQVLHAIFSPIHDALDRLAAATERLAETEAL